MHAPPSTRAGAVGGDVRTSRRSPRPRPASSSPSNAWSGWPPPKESCGSASPLSPDINRSASRRSRLRTRGANSSRPRLAQFDAALDHTRADRVRALADDPPAHLVERLGPVPGSPAGRAVWCHHALGIEAVLDRSDGLGRAAHGQSPAMARARQEVAIADRLLHSSADLADPAGWAELAGQAAALRNEAQRLVMARATIDRLMAPAQQVQPSRGMGGRGSTRARAEPVAGTGTEKGSGPWPHPDRA